ncbi:MAG: transketolase C-terminal domain-containing protein, partial [Clostridia bacterium]
ELFKKEFPQRHIDIGISEQDLVGTACGLSMAGKDVFASSFAMFLAGRAYEQIRNSVAYNKAKVKLCATHAGLTVGEDGPTHQCIEDIALMRVIPNMIVLSPSDENQTKYIIKNSLTLDGPVYIRLGRNEVRDLYRDTDKFEIGKSKAHGKGKKATIFATGYAVHIALDAKEILSDENIETRVIDMYSLKPIDEAQIIKCAKETDILISIEDHSVIGGLGSAVADVLCKEYPKKLYKIGVNDKFGKSGKAKDVLEKYGITKEAIIKIIKDDIEQEN